MDQFIPLEQRQAATVLAGELEQRASRARAAQVAGFPINTTPPPKSAKPVAVPPTKISPGFPADIPAAGNPAPKPVPAKPAIAKPVPVKQETVKAAANEGAWRIQLGAFGEEANAAKLWTSLESRIPELASLQPYLKAAGNITRLQAGPFATKASAEAACAKVKASGQACLTVAR